MAAFNTGEALCLHITIICSMPVWRENKALLSPVAQIVKEPQKEAVAAVCSEQWGWN